MRRIIAIVTVSALLGLGGSAALAHDKLRLIGELGKRNDRAISLKTREGWTFEIALDKNTSISRDGKQIPKAQLKSGQYLVVDAYGDSDKDLLALTIQVVSGPAK